MIRHQLVGVVCERGGPGGLGDRADLEACVAVAPRTLRAARLAEHMDATPIRIEQAHDHARRAAVHLRPREPNVDPARRAFFTLFRDLVASGYWSSRVGVEDLRYTGNTFVAEWKGCPPVVLAKIGLGKGREGS